jgi:hypothetical protein
MPAVQDYYPGYGAPPPAPGADTREPITRFFNALDQFKRGTYNEFTTDPLGALANVGRGMVRSVPQIASQIPDTMVRNATLGLVDPGVARRTDRLLDQTPLASNNTMADAIGEILGPAPVQLAMGAPKIVRGISRYAPQATLDEAAKWRAGKDVNYNYRIQRGDDAAEKARLIAANVEQDRREAQAVRLGRNPFAPVSGFDPEHEVAKLEPGGWRDNPLNPLARTPPFAGGSSTTFTAHDPYGGRVGRIEVEPPGYPKPGDPAFVSNTGVVEDWRRQGVNTEMYNEAEKHYGTLVPSNTLLRPGQEFWVRRNPELLRWRIRESLNRDIMTPVRRGHTLNERFLQSMLDDYRKGRYSAPGVQPMLNEEIQSLLSDLHDQGLLPRGTKPNTYHAPVDAEWTEINTDKKAQPMYDHPSAAQPAPTTFNPPVNPQLVHRWEDHVLGANEPLTRENRWVAQRLLQEYQRRGVPGIKDNGPVTTPTDAILERWGNAPVTGWRGMGAPPPLTRHNPAAKFGPVHEHDLPESFGDLMQGEYLHPEVERVRNQVMDEKHAEYLRRKALFLRLLNAPRGE